MTWFHRHTQFTPEMGVEACTQFQLRFVVPMLVGSCDPYGGQSMHVLFVRMVLRKILLDILVVDLQLALGKLRVFYYMIFIMRE